MKTIDKYFNPDAEARFKAIYGKNTLRANDILRNRMGFMTYKFDKSEVVDNHTKTERVDVKIPDGEKYTLDVIRVEMRNFIEMRIEYYQKNMSLYVSQYKEGLDVYAKTIRSKDEEARFKRYRAYADEIRRAYDPVSHKDIVIYCNKFELQSIIPALPQTMKPVFKAARSVYKYYVLKVQGEALGRILGKKRAQAIVDLIPYAKLPELIDASASKTVIFTSYVEAVKTCDTYLRGEGYEPILVYAETNKHLKQIVAEFEKYVNIDPLIATYDSLSTAVPLVMASTAILLNAPFRPHEYDQATARVDRLDQKHPVSIWNVFLDTGEVPNISTRSNDIMNWAREQVDSILGTKNAPLDLAMECFQDLLEEPVRGIVIKPSYLNW